MKGLDRTSWGCREGHPYARRAADPAIAALLAPWSTGLPPELIERLRSSARGLRLHESLIAAVATALFLDAELF